MTTKRKIPAAFKARAAAAKAMTPAQRAAWSAKMQKARKAAAKKPKATKKNAPGIAQCMACNGSGMVRGRECADCNGTGKNYGGKKNAPPTKKTGAGEHLRRVAEPARGRVAPGSIEHRERQASLVAAGIVNMRADGRPGEGWPTHAEAMKLLRERAAEGSGVAIRTLALVGEKPKKNPPNKRAPKRNAPASKVHPWPDFPTMTRTNAFALAKHFGDDNTASNVASATSAPHLKRAVKAGLVEGAGKDRAKLTAAGQRFLVVSGHRA